MLSHERRKWGEGYQLIAGIDEVGRGPLAGPVTAAAVIFPKISRIPVVGDSKKLNEKRRNEIYQFLLETGKIQCAIANVSPAEIDEVNILRATHIAMKKAVNMLKSAEIALIDGLPVPNFPIPSKAIIRGDSKSASIAAASVLAKVHRDRLMVEYSKKYPQYGFERNKGYGTAEHLKALREHGPCEIHRKSFAPVRDTIAPDTVFQPELIF